LSDIRRRVQLRGAGGKEELEGWGIQYWCAHFGRGRSLKRRLGVGTDCRETMITPVTSAAATTPGVQCLAYLMRGGTPASGQR
jgi:hypothetical protein